VTDGEHLVIAERPSFADALIAALSDSTEGKRLAYNARVRVRELYDWSTVGAAACDAVARLGRN
jgi:glycosyltransferase involved in cell wall biosynthesis